MAVSVRPVAFVALSNSRDRTVLPEGAVWSMKDATLVRGVVEGGPRYGDLWQRSGAHVGDVGLGLTYAEFGAAQEFLAVLQLNGEAFSRLYTVNPATGVYTQVTNGGGPDNPQSMPSGGRWYFAQYLDWVYACHDGSAGKLYRHRVGVNGSAEAWQQWSPVFNRGGTNRTEVENGFFSGLQVKAVSLVGADSRLSVELGQAGLFTINNAGGGVLTGPVATYIVVDLAEDVDFGFVDRLRVRTTESVGLSASSLGAFWAFTADATTVPTVAWAASFTSGGLVDRALLSGTTHEWAGVMFRRSGALSVKTQERDTLGSAKRLVVRVRLTIDPAGGSYTFDSIDLGYYQWRLAAPIHAHTSGYRYVDPDGVRRYTPVVTLGTIDDTAAAGLAVAGATYTMGSKLTHFAPYDARKRDEGYRLIEFMRRNTTDPAKWAVVGGAENAPGASFVDSWTATDVNSASSVPAEGIAAAGPTNGSRIATWKGHVVLGHERRVWLSTQGLPGEFLQSAEDLVGEFSEADETLARTVYVAPDRSESALAIVGGLDSLYVVTRRDVLAMVGDSAQEATQPMPLPGSRGGLGPYGACAHQGGVALAHRDGLYWYRVSRSDAGGKVGATEVEEITAAVRDSWSRFLAGKDGSGIVLASHDSELWAFHAFGSTAAEQKYMRLTKPVVTAEGLSAPVWEEGQFAPVTAAVSTARHGLRVLLGNGTMRRVGTDALGVAYTTNDGSPVSWEVETTDTVTMREQVIGARVEAIGDPAVFLRVFDGLRDTVGTEYEIPRSAGQDWAQGLQVPPYTRYRVRATGIVGTDVLRSVALLVQAAGVGYGN